MTEDEIREAARVFNAALDKQPVPVRDEKRLDVIRKANGFKEKDDENNDRCLKRFSRY